MSRFFTTHRYAPISTGHRNWQESGKCAWTHGHGRIVEITFGASELDNRGTSVSNNDLGVIENWLKNEWDHRILIAHDDPLLPEFNALHELGGINLNIMHSPYGPSVEQSSTYVFDKVDHIIKEITNNRCWVQLVQIWEHYNTAIMYGSFPDPTT